MAFNKTSFTSDSWLCLSKFWQHILFILQGTEKTDMNGCCITCEYESIR